MASLNCKTLIIDEDLTPSQQVRISHTRATVTES